MPEPRGKGTALLGSCLWATGLGRRCCAGIWPASGTKGLGSGCGPRTCLVRCKPFSTHAYFPSCPFAFAVYAYALQRGTHTHTHTFTPCCRSTTTCSRPTRRAARSTCRARCTVQRSGLSRSSRSRGCPRMTAAAAAAGAGSSSSSRRAGSDNSLQGQPRAAATNVPPLLDSLCTDPLFSALLVLTCYFCCPCLSVLTPAAPLADLLSCCLC